MLEETGIIDRILPKKENVVLAKWCAVCLSTTSCRLDQIHVVILTVTRVLAPVLIHAA